MGQKSKYYKDGHNGSGWADPFDTFYEIYK